MQVKKPCFLSVHVCCHVRDHRERRHRREMPLQRVHTIQVGEHQGLLREREKYCRFACGTIFDAELKYFDFEPKQTIPFFLQNFDRRIEPLL